MHVSFWALIKVCITQPFARLQETLCVVHKPKSYSLQGRGEEMQADRIRTHFWL